jgi:uncharacterized protein
MDSFFSWKDDKLLLQVHLQPRSSRNSILGLHANRIKIALTAAPVDNKANECLIDFLADYFAVKKSAITIIKGQTSRNKMVSIRPGLHKDAIIKKLSELLVNFNV